MSTKASRKAVHKENVSFSDFSETIKAVARGGASLPEWAGKRVYADDNARQYWSAQRVVKRAQLAAVTKLISDNHRLFVAMLKDRPESVVALARVVGRSESNVSRSLGKLRRLGIVEMQAGQGRSKQPVLSTDRVVIELDLASGGAVINRREAPASAAKPKARIVRKVRAAATA